VRIYTGSDHAGFSLRKTLRERLLGSGHDVVDLGTDSDGACDYPEFASAVANAVRNDPGSLGVLVCATGQGMAIAAGKVRGIRAVVPASAEAARLSRFDNDANVLCIASRTMPESDALAIVDTWLATGFAGGRHSRRIAKIAAIETASAVSFVTESERLGLAASGIPARIFDRDASLFTSDVTRHAAIERSLAWLSFPSDIAPEIPNIMSFAEDVRQGHARQLILLVDDPAKSSVVALARLWGGSGLRLQVLGGVDADGEPPSPRAPSGLDSSVILVIDDKNRMPSGREQALWSELHDKYCGDAQRAGRHFAAIAAPGSRLAEIARLHRYDKVFSEPAGTNDCHRIFGLAGLLTGMLCGVDPTRVLARTKAMAEACRSERLDSNPGVSLGVLVGAMAKHGRNRVTLLVSHSLQPMRGWIGQAFASTCGAGRGEILVEGGEPLLASYAPNRVFVNIQAADDPPAIAQEQMEALHIAGHPFIQIAVHDKLDVLAELYRWGVAATVSAVLLGNYCVRGDSPAAHPRTGSDLPVAPTA
jgi:ribose 5-phosphate isomerase B